MTPLYLEVMDAVELLQDDWSERSILVVFFQSKRGWRTYSQRNPQRNTSYAAERCADVGAVDITKNESRLRLTDHHLADLDDRRKIGVVGNIVHDLLRVRPESLLKRLD
jgi:hypothetical protein